MKAYSDAASPYAAMLASQDVAERCKQLGITALCAHQTVGHWRQQN